MGIQEAFPDLGIRLRGRGLVFGLECADPAINARLVAECFSRGLIIETGGSTRSVLKFLPPLTVAPDVLESALAIVTEGIGAVSAARPAVQAT